MTNPVLLAWLESTRPSPTTGAPATPMREIDHGGDRAGRGALASECARVIATPPGARDDALNVAAFRMGQLVGAGHLELTRVVEELTLAGLACGQTEAEVARALRLDENGGLARGQLEPRRMESRETGPGPLTSWAPPPPPEDLDVDAAVSEAFPIVDWHAVWEDEVGEDWIVEPLIAARRLIALYSPPKVGKSLLMLEVAAGIASGGIVLGGRITEPRRVLYVDFENDIRGDIVPRLRAMGYAPDDLHRLRYLSFPSLHALDTHVGGTELLAVATMHEADLVVIDTISRAIAGEENANDTWLAFYRSTGSRLKAAGIGVVRLDHSGKDVEKGMRGGSAKYSDVDAVWQLSEVEPEKAFKLLCTDNRFPIVDKELILRREQTPKLVHRVDPDGSYGVYRDKLRETVARLDELDVSTTLSVRAAADALRDVDHPARQSIVAAAVKLRKARLDDEDDS